MKKIVATNGVTILVDDGDFEKLTARNRRWYIDSYGYPTGWRNDIRQPISMHRVILPKELGKHIDHINRDKLDNRKENLRYVSYSENSQNKPGWTDCGYKGVHKNGRKWIASIFKDKKRYYL